MTNFFPVRRPNVFGKGRKLKPGQMNKNETAYAAYLEELRYTGQVAWYSFEAVKLRLADATFYSPDFVVMLANGSIEIHEVKGCTKKEDGSYGFWSEAKSSVKVKVAAELFPFSFAYVYKLPNSAGGTWAQTRLDANEK